MFTVLSFIRKGKKGRNPQTIRPKSVSTTPEESCIYSSDIKARAKKLHSSTNVSSLSMDNMWIHQGKQREPR